MTDSEMPNLDSIKTLDTRICEVTVYTDRALVTRRGTVALTGNERELAIASLPATLETESVGYGCGYSCCATFGSANPNSV